MSGYRTIARLFNSLGELKTQLSVRRIQREMEKAER